MKTTTIGAGAFKARCLRIMDEVQRTRQEVVITKHGKPLAKLVAVVQEPARPAYGALRGSVLAHGDLTQPLDEKWEADA